MSNFDNSINICNGNGSVLCDSGEGCAFVSSEATLGSVCCFGDQSCYQASNIASFIDNSINATVGIRCDGAESCYETSDTIVARNGGSMYFTGFGAVRYSNITLRNGNEKYSNIYCNSNFGCDGTTLSNGNNLYCLAYFSCWV